MPKKGWTSGEQIIHCMVSNSQSDYGLTMGYLFLQIKKGGGMSINSTVTLTKMGEKMAQLILHEYSILRAARREGGGGGGGEGERGRKGM